MTAAGKVTSGWTPVTCDPVLRHCLQEGRDFYILSCSLHFLFTFPFLPKPPWLELTAVLFPAFRMAFTSWKGGRFARHCYICTSALTILWPRETGTERLTCSPRLAQALAANTRQTIYLISFKVLLQEWEVWLDQTNFVTWRNLSCQKHVIKWKVFSSEIFTLFSRPKALLLLHFRTDLLVVSILPNKVSPQKRKPACVSLQKIKQSFKWN